MPMSATISSTASAGGPSSLHAAGSGGNTKRNASIHKIRELQLRTVDICDHYDIIREIGSGDYGKVVLAVHRDTRSQVALKAVPKLTTPLRDFLTEFHYSYFLSPHYGVLDTYDVAFETPEHYVFAQEVAPLGDLWHVVEKTGGIEEKDLKIVIKQLSLFIAVMILLVMPGDDKDHQAATPFMTSYTVLRLGYAIITSALEFMHEKDLVHRDVRAENILIFSNDFTKVKLTDFGLTRRAGTLVKKRTRSLPTCPPEIWETVRLEGYTVETGSDVWQMAMFIFTCLTAKFPWEKADITDPQFREFIEWQKRKSTRTPKHFKKFSPRLLRLFRRLMEPKPSHRYPVTEVNKYYGDRWLLCRSPRVSSVGVKIADPSDHAQPAAPEALGDLLTNFGLETRVNKDVREQRIHDWIMSSPEQDAPK